MILKTNKDKGRAGLGLAIAYYISIGYTISLPLNDTQWYDLIIEKDGIIKTVQCKFTASEKNVIDLRSTGGTNGKVYDNLLNHKLDLLFCSDKNMNIYSIPVNKIRAIGNINSIVLRTNKNLNNYGFQSYKYLVSIK